MLKKEKIRINRMLGSEGLVNELETGTYKNCTFKTWNGRKKSLTIYGIKSVEWVKKYYGYNNLTLAYCRYPNDELVIIANKGSK